MVAKIKSKSIIIFIILLLLTDQLFKIYIKTHMSIGESIMVLGDWFQLRFVENKGAAYGMELGGEFGKLFLSLIRCILIGLIIYYLRVLLKRKTSIGLLIGISLVLSGAIGNILDSMFYGLIFSESTPWNVAEFVSFGNGYASFMHGSVVDMLYFPLFTINLPEWLPFVGGDLYTFFSPIFNLADSYITVGAFYLILFQRNNLFNRY